MPLPLFRRFMEVIYVVDDTARKHDTIKIKATPIVVLTRDTWHNMHPYIRFVPHSPPTIPTEAHRTITIK